MWWFTTLLVMLVSAQAAAQPADCAPLTQVPPDAPEIAVPVLPLAIDLARRPGVPRGLSGQVYVGVPIAPNGTLECGPALPGPRDILHGPPGDALHGPPRATFCEGQERRWCAWSP